MEAGSLSLGVAAFQPTFEPLSDALRKAALKQDDAALVSEGLLTPAGTVAPQAQKPFEVTVESCIPLQGSSSKAVSMIATSANPNSRTRYSSNWRNRT